MSRRPYYVALGVAVVLVVVLLNLPDRTAAKTKLVISSAFVPLFGLIGSGQSLAEQLIHLATPRHTLVQEIHQLQDQNRALRVLALQGAAALRENARLRQIIGWQQQTRWRVKVGRVIARDTSDWWRSFRIDLGARDGVRPNLPVITVNGLVGRVVQVARTSAVVALVGDPECRVSVVVRETGETGVITSPAEGVLDPRVVDLTHLPRHSALHPGESVFTSGEGGVFPAGLPVGTIIDSRSVGYGLSTEARVKLAVDSGQLREVMVLFP